MFFLQKLPLVFSLFIIRCKTEMEPFVVGGVLDTITDFPHSVYLAIDCSKPWICGASILNQKILLTAAHCIDVCDTNNKDHLIEAYAGHENLVKVRSKREIGKIRIHEKYDAHTAANDIALAALKRSLYLGHTIKRIIIKPHFPHVHGGQLAGWGVVDEEKPNTATILKSVPQKIRSKRVCSRVEILEEGMFCAGSTREETNHPADGDSGSALVTNDFIEIGIVSFRSRRLPTLMVYTNVSYYYKWITIHAKELYCRVIHKYGDNA